MRLERRVTARRGGVSTVFPRPAFQNAVRDVVGDYRGTPTSAVGAVDGGVTVYTSTTRRHGLERRRRHERGRALFAGLVASRAAAGHA